MDNYLFILKQKAKKINADCERCGNDKDCIKDILAAKIKSNLQKDDLTVLKDKAEKINADISNCDNDKNAILDTIEQRIKDVLEEENQLMTSLDLQQNFKPLYFSQDFGDFSDIG